MLLADLEMAFAAGARGSRPGAAAAGASGAGGPPAGASGAGASAASSSQRSTQKGGGGDEAKLPFCPYCERRMGKVSDTCFNCEKCERVSVFITLCPPEKHPVPSKLKCFKCSEPTVQVAAYQYRCIGSCSPTDFVWYGLHLKKSEPKPKS
jgi:hypothetical protein